MTDNDRWVKAIDDWAAKSDVENARRLRSAGAEIKRLTIWIEAIKESPQNTDYYTTKALNGEWYSPPSITD